MSRPVLTDQLHAVLPKVCFAFRLVDLMNVFTLVPHVLECPRCVAGSEYEERPPILAATIAPTMRSASRHEHPSSRRHTLGYLSEPDGELARYDVDHFIRSPVKVQGSATTRRHHFLEHCDPAACLLSQQFEYCGTPSLHVPHRA